jgi:hypothetical protein
MSFGVASQIMYRWFRSQEIVSGTENCALLPSKMGSKNEKYEFWQRHSNHVSVVTVARNCPENRKLCAIAHGNGQKT